MAYKDLYDFLVALSKHQALREAFEKDPAGVGAEAGLTQQEVSLLEAGNELEIRNYLGDEFGDAISVKIRP